MCNRNIARYNALTDALDALFYFKIDQIDEGISDEELNMIKKCEDIIGNLRRQEEKC